MSSKSGPNVKLPAHRAGLPGKERTRDDRAPKYLRKGGVHPHLCPLPSRERKIKEWGLSQAPPVKLPA